MPVLQFYTNTNQLTAAEKQELARILTDFYAQRMPDFFVNIMFNEVSHSHSWHSPARCITHESLTSVSASFSSPMAPSS